MKSLYTTGTLTTVGALILAGLCAFQMKPLEPFLFALYTFSISISSWGFLSLIFIKDSKKTLECLEHLLKGYSNHTDAIVFLTKTLQLTHKCGCKEKKDG